MTNSWAYKQERHIKCKSCGNETPNYGTNMCWKCMEIYKIIQSNTEGVISILKTMGYTIKERKKNDK